VRFAVWCILTAAALPYFFLLLSGWPSNELPARWGNQYDARAPRESAEKLSGWRKRAHQAQLNGHEAFAPFAVALICAQLVSISEPVLHGLALAFLGFRVVHGVAYLLNRPLLRALSWSFGFACVVGLYAETLYRLS
jgi:uncharacterized MAPEG superfamily protein